MLHRFFSGVCSAAFLFSALSPATPGAFAQTKPARESEAPATPVSTHGLKPLARQADTPQGGEKEFFAVAAPAMEAAPEKQALNARIIANYTGRKYRLGPNDVISISVYDAPEFSQPDLLIQPDGNITLAPFGSLPVAGLTIEELEKDLAERLRFYLKAPRVTVKLSNTKPFQIYVTGAVLHPGAYEIVTDMHRANQMNNNLTPSVLQERKLPLLSNVIVATGGLRYDADWEHIKVYNRFDRTSFEVNLLDLIQNGNTEQDLFLIAGDSISVPSLPSAYGVDEGKYRSMLGSSFFQQEIPVKVYGYVNRPGLVMLNSAQSANLNSAIASAGGYLSTEASYAPTRVYISRMDQNGRLATTTVDPRHEDLTLRPNDVVYIPNKVTPRVGKAFDYLARVVTPLSAIGQGANSWTLLFQPTRYSNINPRQ